MNDCLAIFCALVYTWYRSFPKLEVNNAMNVTWVSLGVFGVTIILSVKSGQAFTVSQDHPPYLQALLPSPIVESTLDEYCTWVNASDAQRLAIRSYHDSYLQTYESVRNEVLERLKAPCELIHMSSLPHPDDLRHVVGITQRAIGELSAMDNRFLFQFREIPYFCRHTFCVRYARSERIKLFH